MKPLNSLQLQRPLLKNSLRFLKQAAQDVNARKDVETRHAFACVHAGIGVELVVKARLAKDHYSLIFESVDSVPESLSKLTSARTVSFRKGISRLLSLCNSSVDKKEADSLIRIYELRNRAAHYDLQIDKHHARAVVSRAIEIAVHIIESDLVSASKVFAEDLDDLRVISVRLDHFVKARMQRIAGSDDYKPDRMCVCPRCNRLAEVADTQGLVCLMCGARRDWSQLADCAGELCYYCGADSLRLQGSSGRLDKNDSTSELFHAICSSCMRENCLSECPRCYQLHSGSGLCDPCSSWLDKQ